MTTHVKQVRVRLAPSPTGRFHVGTARTALFNWLFAKQNSGVFVVRIEDTDTDRSEKKFEGEILESLTWLGLEWDEGPILATGENYQLPITNFQKKNETKESKNSSVIENSELKIENYKGAYGPYRQSERKNIYKKYVEKLLSEGKAYQCYCAKEELEAERQTILSQGLPPKYGGHCRNLTTAPAGKSPQVIRFKTPEAKVEFKDIIRGKVAFDAALLGDMVIAKDTSSPLYNLANVIDDELMNITHVIRGEDHLSNTQKQILFAHAFGFRQVEYAHLPLILAPDRSKLSKRFSESSLLEYRTRGYLPEALINFLALLGWHPQGDIEVMIPKELIEKFDLKRVQKAGAIFNEEKLEWLQKEHFKMLSSEEIIKKLTPLLEEKEIAAKPEFVEKIVRAEKSRIKNLNEFVNTAEFFFKMPEYDAVMLSWQNKQTLSQAKSILASVLDLLAEMKEETKREKVSQAIERLIGSEGRGAVFWPLRVALSGQRVSPDPIEIIDVLGLEKSKNRIRAAIEKIENSPLNLKS